MVGLIWKVTKKKIIAPLVGLKDSPEKIALGVAIGLFLGLMPTVGLQMSFVVALAALGRAYNELVRRAFPSRTVPRRSALPELHFNIPAGVAMVWITNPLTMVPLYYGMYLIGTLSMGMEALVSFAGFKAKWAEILGSPTLWAQIKASFVVLGEIAWPMFVGGVISGLVCGTAAYPITKWLVVRHRTKKAAKLGLTYAEFARRLAAEFERENMAQAGAAQAAGGEVAAAAAGGAPGADPPAADTPDAGTPAAGTPAAGTPDKESEKESCSCTRR